MKIVVSDATSENR